MDNTPHALQEFFDIHIEILFSKTFTQRQIIIIIIKKMKAFLGFA